jgi:hypothetical protein
VADLTEGQQRGGSSGQCPGHPLFAGGHICAGTTGMQLNSFLIPPIINGNFAKVANSRDWRFESYTEGEQTNE